MADKTEDFDKDLYTIALLRYKEENPNLNVDTMFSLEWNLSSNYKLKNMIIAEAIQKHVLVEKTQLYKENFGISKKISLNKQQNKVET